MPSDDLTLRIRSRGGRAAARDVDETKRSVDRFGKSARTSSKHATTLGRTTGLLFKPFHHLRQEAFSLAKGVAAAGIAFGSVEGIKRSIETTDSLVKTTVKLHHQFGLSTEAASGLGAVLQARDLQPQGLTMGLTALAKQLVAAEHGSKTAQGAFRIFGIRARDVHAAIGSRDGLSNVFQTVVDQLSDMPGGARKAAVSQQLLGRASRGLAPLLQEGALGLKQQLRWAKEFGVTLDEHTVGSVEDMAAAQTEAQYAMLGLQIQIGRFAAPAVAKANVALADIVRSFRDGRPEGSKFARTVYQLGTDLAPVGRGLLQVGGYLKDHPRLLRLAAAGYVAYRLKLLKLISLAPVAYGKGLVAGRSYSLGFERGATTGVAVGRYSAVGRAMGATMGVAAGVMMAPLIIDQVENALTHLGWKRPGRKAKVKGPRSFLNSVVDSSSRLLPDTSDRGPLGQLLFPKNDSRPNRSRQSPFHVATKLGVIESHITVNMDGKPAAKVVHRQAVKAKSTR